MDGPGQTYPGNMPRVVIIVVLALLTIYAIVEVAQADSSRVRNMPRWLWAAAIICLPALGACAWFLFGRPLPQRPAPKRPIAPDDDPDFLRRLRPPK